MSDSPPKESVEAILALLPPIFRDCCCCDENRRYSLACPWVKGDFIYATDGRICVRAPRASHEAAAELMMRLDERKVPKAEEVFSLLSDPAGTGTLPPVKGPVECDRCSGGNLRPRCECCDQELPECPDCDGDGESWDYNLRVPVSPTVAIGHKYAFILGKHGVKTCSYREPGKEVTLEVQGCDGILMALVGEGARKR